MTFRKMESNKSKPTTIKLHKSNQQSFESNQILFWHIFISQPSHFILLLLSNCHHCNINQTFSLQTSPRDFISKTQSFIHSRKALSCHLILVGIFLSNPIEFPCQPSLPIPVSVLFIPTKLASLKAKFHCPRPYRLF